MEKEYPKCAQAEFVACHLQKKAGSFAGLMQ
jgi:hypothetical protein